MHFRKLKNGEECEDLDSPIVLIIYTKSPNKYKLIDLETGEEYIGCKKGNPSYHKSLIEKINVNNVGQWTKVKAKNE